MTTHTARQPLRPRPTTQPRAFTFAEARTQLDALNADIAAGVHRTAELSARIGRFEEATRPKVKTRDDVYDDFVRAATQRFSELPTQQAVSAFLGTPEGYRLHRAYMAAPGAPVAAPTVDPYAGRGQAYREVNQKIDAAADELRAADPTLSREQAVVQILERWPQLFAEYSEARREDRAMRGV